MNHQEIVGTLNRLIETTKDGEYGLQTCADRAPTNELRLLFVAHADECRRAADELQTLVREHGGFAPDHGTAVGTVQRGWQNMKNRLGSSTPQAALEEAEHCAARTHEGFQAALQAQLPMILRVVVERLHEADKRHHAQLRARLERAAPAPHARDGADGRPD